MRLPHICGAVLLVAVLVAVTGCGDKPANTPAQNPAAAPPPVAAPPAGAAEVKIEGWGPQETKAGEPFNVQPTGKSALWIKVTGLNTSAGVRLLFGDKSLENVEVANNLVTGALPVQNMLLDQPGDLDFVLVEVATNRKVPVGTFKVLPK